MWRYFVLLLPFITLRAVLPIVVGLVPAFYGWKAYSQDRDLRELGKLVDAHITEKTKRNNYFHIKYSFVDLQGMEWKAERDLGTEFNEMVNTSDFFLLTYLPSHPEIHIVGGRSATTIRGTLSIAMIGIAVLLCGWGTWGLFHSVWQMYRIRHLFKHGEVASATVGELVKESVKNRKQKHQMTFHFVAMNGRWYEGRSRDFSLHFLNKWPSGTHINVVYDRTNPLRCEPDLFKLLG